ncbi:MAG: nucleoside hydrolase, partial [Rhodothermaceae bacterium]|nr:nucleoside hydrolase [Rhodothermaceae bacterium]
QKEHAVSFLERRLSRASRPVRVLALGALTTLTTLTRASAPALEELVIMGGAVDVPGNVNDSDEFVSPNGKAEWNFFVDPLAASKVFASDLPITLIPLDATNQVPVKIPFIDEFIRMARCPIGRMTSQVLESIRPFAAQGVFYAWDPLAAVYLVNPDIVTLTRFPVEVKASGPDAGNSCRSDAGCICFVATSAQGKLFTRYFTAPFEESARAYS